MKQFLDLLGISPNIEVKIVLTPVQEFGAPNTQVKINNEIIFDNPLTKTIILSYNIDILSPAIIQIRLSDKQYSTRGDTAIIVNQIAIDDIDIIPEYSHLVDYINDHNNNNPTNYLGFNGTWTLAINQPFYHWLHEHTGQGWLLT